MAWHGKEIPFLMPPQGLVVPSKPQTLIPIPQVLTEGPEGGCL